MRIFCGESAVVWSKISMQQVCEQIPPYLCRGRSGSDNPAGQAWVHEGDLSLDGLDLGRGKNAEEEPSLLLVRGNLTVRGSVFNEDTEGAISLVVVGNLQADNLVVGGQEVCVAGSAQISGLLYGGYRCGNMQVEGQTKARVLIANDACHFSFAHAPLTQFVFEGSDELPKSAGMPLILHDVLCAECLTGIDGELDRSGMIAMLRDGRSLLKDIDAVIDARGDRIFSCFADDTLGSVNFKKLFNSALMQGGNCYQFTAGGVNFAVMRKPDETESDRLYFEDAERKFCLCVAEDSEWELLCRDNSCASDQWVVVDAESAVFPVFFSYWRDLLNCVSIAQYYSQSICKSELEAVFAQGELCRPDAGEGSDAGIRNGKSVYRFRREAAGMMIEIQAPSKNRYFYEYAEARLRRFCIVFGESERQELSYNDLARWEFSEVLFAAMCRYFEQQTICA